MTAVAAIVGASARRSMTAARRRTAKTLTPTRISSRFDTDRSYVVTTPDGVPLAVREAGPADAPLTMVFVHGFCLRMGAFHFQRTRLPEHVGPQRPDGLLRPARARPLRRGPPETYTLTQLGKDLESVLKVIAPRGLIVLVGHSMGGMTVLSHARQFPEHYGRRIVGAALISSAAEGVSRSPLGEILKNPALEAFRFTARSAPEADAPRPQRVTVADRPGSAGRVLQRPARQPEPGSRSPSG